MTEKKKPTKKETSEERTMNAFYMLAKVVEQNTQMFEALIVAINSASQPPVMTGDPNITPTPGPAIPETTPAEEHTYAEDDCKDVLVALVTKHGKEKGMAHLKNYNATKISEVPEHCRENFVLTGRLIVEGGFDE
jgi:hypothetical protein